MFSPATLGGNNGFTLLIDPQVESFHGLKATTRICLTTTKQQTYGFGEISRKVCQNVKWDGKRGPWNVAILTKWWIGRNAHRLFSHLLSYIPQTHGKFPLDSPFSSNLPLYKECDIEVYWPIPGQISPYFFIFTRGQFNKSFASVIYKLKLLS